MIWWARYVGLPYDAAALNCWSLVRQVYADHLNVNLPEYGDVDPNQIDRVARRMDSPPADWVKVDSPQAFDVMLASARPGSRVPLHAGVMVDAHKVLHVWEATNACVMPINHLFLAGRVLGYHRHKVNVECV